MAQKSGIIIKATTILVLNRAVVAHLCDKSQEYQKIVGKLCLLH